MDIKVLSTNHAHKVTFELIMALYSIGGYSMAINSGVYNKTVMDMLLAGM